MPTAMGFAVHCVVIGDNVYVGGGYGGRVNAHERCTVMKLDLQRDEWIKLPQYSTKYFGMTSLGNQLVLVGGAEPSTGKPTKQVGVFSSGKWIHPYPPMNFARQCLTAVCFNNSIIVAGGHYSVEVLDTTSRRWYTVETLPFLQSRVKSTLIGNTLYLMGLGVYKVDLHTLITSAILFKQTTLIHLQMIEDTPLKDSAPLNVRGSLLVVGGRDDCVNPSSSIHLYQPDTKRWVKVGDLPTARYNCTCSLLPSGEVIVAGGEARTPRYISTVDFVSICDAH